MSTPAMKDTTKPAFQAIRVDLLDRLLDQADKMTTQGETPAPTRRKLQ